MSETTERDDDGIDRRGFLQCMAWAGTGLVWTVAAGTRVTWVNHDDSPHTVTSTARPKAFDSGAMDTDAAFTFVFPAPGTYEYFCAVHPRMTGKVIVK